MRRRVYAAWSPYFLVDLTSTIALGLLMKSQAGRSFSRRCGLGPFELRGLFQDRISPAAMPSAHSAVIISEM